MSPIPDAVSLWSNLCAGKSKNTNLGDTVSGKHYYKDNLQHYKNFRVEYHCRNACSNTEKKIHGTKLVKNDKLLIK